MRRLHKLLRMSRHELVWRSAVVLHGIRDRVAVGLGRPRWNRRDLTSALAPDVLDPLLTAHVARGDWMAAQRRLVNTLQDRRRPFTLDPHTALELRHEILRRWPHASADASRRADRLMGGSYDLLGYRGLSFDDDRGHIDWHLDPVHRRRAPRIFWGDVPFLDPSVGDHKIIWELNRHQHWLRLGRALWLTRDRRYAWAIVSQLESWLDANPPLTGVNWASALELGLRSMSWVWALHFLLADTQEGATGPAPTPWVIDLLIGIDAQLSYVERNLSYYFSPNTHLLGEALALYVVGLSLPELAASSRWTTTGRAILLAEIDRQIGADGGHAERSTHYHRYTLDFYLLALLMAEKADDAESVARFTDAVGRAADFARAIADDSGRLPLIGDDDGGMLWPIAGRPCDDVRDSLALAAVVLGRPDLAPWGIPEEVFWIAGRTAVEQEPYIAAHRATEPHAGSRALTDTGYVVARDGEGGHLVFDVGAHGYLNGGHAHADALSITLAVGGRPLLIDPGTGTYTMDAKVRDRFRRTANHNTLMLDGRSSALPSGPFHWYSRTDAHTGALRHNPRFDWAEGWHDGYAGNRHRRSVFRAAGGGWLIVDEVLGRGEHVADLHWHFDPAWTVVADRPSTLRASHLQGGTAWIVHDGDTATLLHGDDQTGLGWCAPAYGTLLPTWTARVSRSGPSPLRIVTWVCDAADPPTLAGVPVEDDPGGEAPIAVAVIEGRATRMTLLRPGDADQRDTRACRVGAYHTDARLLHVDSIDGRLRSLAACDANHILALHDGWLSVAADAPLSDLHVDIHDDRLELWSSAPGARVQLQGAIVAGVRTVRLNGRERTAAPRDRLDSLVLSTSDWGEPQRIVVCAASLAS